MPLHGCIVTCTLHLYALELHGIRVCGVECHALVVNSVDFSSALKTTPSSSGRSRHAPAPVQGKKQKPHKHKNRQKRWSLSKGRACWSPWNTCEQKTALLASRSTKVPIVPGGPSCIFTRACVAVSILNIARTASMRFCSRAFGPCLRCDVKTRLRRPHHHSIERPVGDVAQVVRSTIFRSAAKKTSFVQGAAAF